MFEDYKNLMAQQHPAEDASAFFDEPQVAPVKRMPVLKKVLIAAACICLLIPTAVLAAENIFDISIVSSKSSFLFLFLRTVLNRLFFVLKSSSNYYLTLNHSNNVYFT